MISREQSVEEQLAAMSFAERERWWRQRYIEQGVAWGMPASLDWVKDAQEEQDDELPEQGLNSQVAEEKSNAYLSGDWLSELDEEYPEDKRFFMKLDEHFPEGYQWVHIVDPASSSGSQFFRKLKNEFPEAWEFFLGDVE